MLVASSKVDFRSGLSLLPRPDHREADGHLYSYSRPRNASSNRPQCHEVGSRLRRVPTRGDGRAPLVKMQRANVSSLADVQGDGGREIRRVWPFWDSDCRVQGPDQARLSADIRQRLKGSAGPLLDLAIHLPWPLI